MLTNEVGTFRYPKTHLAITPTRIGDVELHYMIFGGNSLFERIKAHRLKLTAEDLPRAIEQATEDLQESIDWRQWYRKRPQYLPDNFEEPRRSDVNNTRGDLTRPKNPNMSIKRIWREWLIHQAGDVSTPEEVFESIN